MAGKGKAGEAPGAGPLFDSADEAAGTAPVARAPAKDRIGLLPIAGVAMLVAAGLWGAWVTKSVLEARDLPPLARVQLSGIVGEYVQAQARSATPPEQVTSETRAFMAEIQKNLEQRGAKGQIVLVGEAVLAGDVPDITAALRREVYAKVRMPQPAQASPTDVIGAMRSAMDNPAGLALGGSANAPAN
jgi:hypothetical protein